MPSSGWMRRTRALGCRPSDVGGREGQVGDPLELQGHLGDPLGQPLAGADVDRHAGPAPVVDLELHGHVGLGLAVGVDALLLAVAGHRAGPRTSRRRTGPAPRRSATSSGVGISTARRALTFSSRMPWASMVAGRLHQGERQDLHDVVLDDVAQGAGGLVEAAPVLDAERLGHGDLHVVDVAAVPDRLEDGVGEAQGQDVLDRLLPQVVVDPVDLRLRRRRGAGRRRAGGRWPGPARTASR